MTPNPFPYSSDNKRYHTWSHHLRATFGRKVAKVALDAGFTCPNIDGSRGRGGCAYCAGAASHRPSPPASLLTAYEQGLAVQQAKWPGAACIAYFQARTNTYAPVEHLRTVFEPALSFPGVVGLSIATRADCLPPETVEYLSDLSRRTWLVVELGLQTVHDATAQAVNRCHTYGDFLESFFRLQAAGIRVCVHLINGLPGETTAMMLQSAEQVGALSPHSIKLHMLHLLRGTPLAARYEAEPEAFSLPNRDQYIALVCDQLERLPAPIVLQRLTGDPPREALIAPRWTLDKRFILNGIDRELARRGTFQGYRLQTGSSH